MKKYSYVYEIPLFYFVLCVLNYTLFPNYPGFYEIHPHPFWLGILLFGMRYGIIAGTVSGFLSALIYLVSIWFFGERYLFEDTPFYTQPSFFIVFGTLIGLGVYRYHHQIAQLKIRLADTADFNTQLLEEQKNQRIINTALEKRIVTKMSTLVSLYEGARKLESINLNEIYTAILEFFSKTLNLNQASIYFKTQQGWVLHKQQGWQNQAEWPAQYLFGEGSLIDLAGNHKKIMSIRDIIGKPTDTNTSPNNSQNNTINFNLKNECLMAGPIRSGENGEALAVFAIQGMALLDLNSATTNLFSFLLNWANRSIARALFFEELKSQEILDPQYNIYSYRYFETRLKQELLRSKTYYLPLSLLLIHLKGINTLTPGEKNTLFTAVSALLKNCCDDTDVIASYPDNEIPFACLLTTTTDGKAEKIKNTILEKYKVLGLSERAPLQIGKASFTPTITSLEAILNLAKEDFSHAA